MDFDTLPTNNAAEVSVEDAVVAATSSLPQSHSAWSPSPRRCRGTTPGIREFAPRELGA
jgi:hypothetical protein